MDARASSWGGHTQNYTCNLFFSRPDFLRARFNRWLSPILRTRARARFAFISFITIRSPLSALFLLEAIFFSFFTHCCVYYSPARMDSRLFFSPSVSEQTVGAQTFSLVAEHCRFSAIGAELNWLLDFRTLPDLLSHSRVCFFVSTRNLYDKYEMTNKQ